MNPEQFSPPTPSALGDVEVQEIVERTKLGDSGVLGAIEILETQARLREVDKFALNAWRTKMLEIGSIESLEALKNFDRAAQGLLPVSVTSTPHITDVKAELKPVAGVETEVTEVAEVVKLVAKGGASSQFWVWLTVSGSLLPLGLALWLQSLGLTLAQSITAAVLGIFVSAGVVAIGAIAGKRSSLPTIVLSRAAFGVFGNFAPSGVLVVSRLFWCLVLVALGYLLISQNYEAMPAILTAGAVTDFPFLPIALLVLIILGAVTLALLGGKKLAWAQRISGIIGLLVSITLVIANVTTGSQIVQNQGSGSWLRALGAAVVIFAVFGLSWSSASADFASSLSVRVRGWKVVVWALLSMGAIPAGITTLGLVAYGSKPPVSSFISSVTGAFDKGWLNGLVQGSVALSLITVIAMTLRSSSMSFESMFLRLKTPILIPVIALSAATLAVFGLSYLGVAGIWLNLHGYALFLAVPVAAWSGIFVSDVLIRRIAYHEVSLSRAYGFYKSVNLVNLGGWLFAVALGWGLLKSDLIEFQWVGYLSDYASNSEFWAQSNFGIIMAFAVGLLLPVVAGIPRIKSQEVEVLKIEARRDDLKGVRELVD